MYHAGEMEAVLLLDGNDIPVAAHGDQGVLKIFLVVRIVQNMLQLRLDPVPGGQDADAEAAQLDRRRVEDFPFFGDGLLHLAHDFREFLEFPSVGRQVRMLVAACEKKNLEGCEAFRAGPDVLKFFYFEDTAHFGAFDRRSNVVQAAKGEALCLVEEVLRFGRLHQAPPHGLVVRADRHGEDFFLAQLGRRALGGQLLDFIKFECLD